MGKLFSLVKLVTFLCGLLFLVYPPSEVMARSASQQGWGASYETHKQVIELLFPRELGVGYLRNLKYRITLRYFPHPDPGSQIIIKVYPDENFEVVSFMLPPGSKRIDEQVEQIYRETGRENPKEMANHIRVDVREVSIPPSVMHELLQRFGRLCVGPQLETGIVLGYETGYHIWYESASGNLHIWMAGPHPEHDKRADSLVRWMNDVKRAVDKARRASE